MIKHATSWNQPKPATTTQNHPKLPKNNHNYQIPTTASLIHPKPAKTPPILNQPKQPKSYKTTPNDLQRQVYLQISEIYNQNFP